VKADTSKQTGRTFPLSGLTATALKNYEQAVRSGLKLQEESWQWWSGMFNPAACSENWQKKLNKLNGLASDLVPLVQERLEDAMTIVESNTRTGTELMKQAIDASQTLVVADGQAKWMNFWSSTLSAAQTNAAALAKVSSKAVDAWTDFIQKNTELMEVRVPKTA
jgi:hypothetical protein